MEKFNLVNRTTYTFFSSLLRVQDIIDYSLENNIPYASIVDLNIMYGAYELYEKAIENNLKPIIGLQVIYHGINEIFIAKNYLGYKELMRISSYIMTDKEVAIDDSNLIRLEKRIKINAFKYEKDRKTLELFARIGSRDEMVLPLTSLESTESEQEYINSIISQIDLKIPERKNILPKFETKNGQSSESFLENILHENLNKLLIRNPELQNSVYEERLNFELEVIKKMSYQNYFLIVWDIIKWAKDNDIFVGPGRGSASGSLISYLLNITTIDPIKNDLLFERFLNPERISMPDIDIDFEDDRREEVVNYIREKYGNDYMAQIITFQTLRAKMSIKDVAREMNISVPKANSITKILTDKDSLIYASKKNKKFMNLLETDEEVKEIWESAKLIEGLPRQYSTHAAGVVLSNNKIYESIPIQNGMNNYFQTQYPMNYMEVNGLLKIDILGLRNLTFLKDIISLTGKEININEIDMNDKKVFSLLSRGRTSGIFQLESHGMASVLRKMKVDKFEDIVATTSLYRPGPQKMIPKYIEGKNNPEKIIYLDSSLKPILEKTYGIIVYQEQIMEIAKQFAGLSLAKADILRRAIGKKDVKLIDSIKEEFIESAKKMGRSSESIESIYQLIYEFSEYGFNRSHAFAYSIISYQLSYLKVNYPLEFMVALLSSVQGNAEKICQYIDESKQSGINIIRPDINKSNEEFIIEDDSIRYSLKAIKGIGPTGVSELIEERNENGKYKNYIDFIVRIANKSLKRNIIELLIKSGTLDGFGLSRSTMLANIENLLAYASIITIDKDGEKIIDYSLSEQKPNIKIVEDEKSDIEFDHESLGFTFEESVLSKYRSKFKELEVEQIISIGDEPRNVRVAGEIKFIKNIKTKFGADMARLTLEDQTDRITITIWPEKYNNLKEEIKVGNIILVEGNLDMKFGKSVIMKRMKLVENVE